MRARLGQLCLATCLAFSSLAQAAPDRTTDIPAMKKSVILTSRGKGQTKLVLESTGEKKKVSINKKFFLKRDETKTSLHDLGRE